MQCFRVGNLNDTGHLPEEGQTSGWCFVAELCSSLYFVQWLPLCGEFLY